MAASASSAEISNASTTAAVDMEEKRESVLCTRLAGAHSKAVTALLVLNDRGRDMDGFGGRERERERERERGEERRGEGGRDAARHSALFDVLSVSVALLSRFLPFFFFSLPPILSSSFLSSLPPRLSQ